METHHVIQTLSALAQETRLAIFRELVQAHSPCGDQTGLAAGKLSERLGIPSPTLSFHLKEMSRAHLLTRRRQGRSIIYCADLGAVLSLVGYLLEDCCGGQCGITLSNLKEIQP